MVSSSCVMVVKDDGPWVAALIYSNHTRMVLSSPRESSERSSKLLEIESYADVVATIG